MFRTLLVPVLSLSILAAACSRDLNSATYSDAAIGESSLTYEGTILSMRNVKVKKEKLGENGTGALVGGGTGALAGSAFGKGKGSIATAVGAGLVGAVAGAFAEDALSTTDAIEYIVKVNNGGITKTTTRSGKADKEATLDRKNDVRTIVQAADPALAIGTRVYVIENKNRSRIVPAG